MGNESLKSAEVAKLLLYWNWWIFKKRTIQDVNCEKRSRWLFFFPPWLFTFARTIIIYFSILYVAENSEDLRHCPAAIWYLWQIQPLAAQCLSCSVLPKERKKHLSGKLKTSSRDKVTVTFPSENGQPTFRWNFSDSFALC